MLAETPLHGSPASRGADPPLPQLPKLRSLRGETPALLVAATNPPHTPAAPRFGFLTGQQGIPALHCLPGSRCDHGCL